MPLARISLTLSRHFSLSFIASGGSSGLHPVSSQSCWMYIRAGRPAFARPYVGVHKSTLNTLICLTFFFLYINPYVNLLNLLNVFTKHELTAGFCPWCNGYHRRNWTQRDEFKSSTRLTAFHTALGKGMNPIILPPAKGKIIGQTRFFSLGEATSLGEGKLWIQIC